MDHAIAAHMTQSPHTIGRAQTLAVAHELIEVLSGLRPRRLVVDSILPFIHAGGAMHGAASSKPAKPAPSSSERMRVRRVAMVIRPSPSS